MADIACRAHASSRCSCSYLRAPTRRGTPIVCPAVAPRLQLRPVRSTPSTVRQGMSTRAQSCERLPLASNPRAAAENGSLLSKTVGTKSHGLTCLLGCPVFSWGSCTHEVCVTGVGNCPCLVLVQMIERNCRCIQTQTPHLQDVHIIVANLAGVRCRAATEESLALTEENVEAVLDGV